MFCLFQTRRSRWLHQSWKRWHRPQDLTLTVSSSCHSTCHTPCKTAHPSPQERGSTSRGWRSSRSTSSEYNIVSVVSTIAKQHNELVPLGLDTQTVFVCGQGHLIYTEWKDTCFGLEKYYHCWYLINIAYSEFSQFYPVHICTYKYCTLPLSLDI